MLTTFYSFKKINKLSWCLKLKFDYSLTHKNKQFPIGRNYQMQY
jgi:hypothetical protein